MIVLFAATVRNLPGALLTSMTAWLFHVGFLVNERGELSWDGPQDVAVLALASAAGSAWWLTPALVAHRRTVAETALENGEPVHIDAHARV